MSTSPVSASLRIARIARLNDLARQAMGVACTVFATPGFRGLSPSDQSCVRELIETFDAFTCGNDPYGERDFGAIYQHGDGRWTTTKPNGEVRETIFWKIDAYYRDLQFGSEDPVNPAVTQRVLTIMLAQEY